MSIDEDINIWPMRLSETRWYATALKSKAISDEMEFVKIPKLTITQLSLALKIEAVAWKSEKRRRIIIRYRGVKCGAVAIYWDTLEEMEISYWVIPEYEGKGIAYRAVRAIVNGKCPIGLGAELRKMDITARVKEGNYRSINLLRRVGGFENTGNAEGILEFRRSVQWPT